MAGSRSALVRLAAIIAAVDHVDCTVDDESAPSVHQIRHLEVIEVAGSPVAVEVDRANGRLLVTGGRKCLATFALNIEGLARNGRIGEHQHFEYFPEHSYLSERSAPLILALDPDTQPG